MNKVDFLRKLQKLPDLKNSNIDPKIETFVKKKFGLTEFFGHQNLLYSKTT